MYMLIYHPEQKLTSNAVQIILANACTASGATGAMSPPPSIHHPQKI